MEKTKINDISVNPQVMTEAMHKHFNIREIVASINDEICIKNGQPCIYASNKKKGVSISESETCEFKNQMDDFLYGALKSGLIINLHILHCDHYEPENSMETLSKNMVRISEYA